jgi:ribosomal protein S27AE
MPLKTKICPNCLASFVAETRNQELCNECVLLNKENKNLKNIQQFIKEEVQEDEK